MRRKNFLILSIACSCLSALIFLLGVWVPAQYQVPVLMYHSVAPYSQEPLNNVRLGQFEKQMAYIKNHGYKVLPLGQFVDGLKAGKDFDHKSVVITFDDGYKDNYTSAFPVLKRYGIPATIFVEVGHIGNSNRFTWEDAKEMSASGVDFESHLMTGAYLPDLPLEERISQLTESKRLLEVNLKHPVRFLAFPIGGFDEEGKMLVKKLGYEAAFTTNRGFDRSMKDVYEIKRIRVKDSDFDWQLWLKLSGYYNLFRSSKNPF
ncbi:MAG: polysaccharide deacetylase family protein [Candidatus Omnitrophica bacterium]|nr:polysaccharide deacetylase family protein [Candidatus Omnitrophota bacterium]